MPPVNPTGKTWELVNEGDAKGSTDNVIGGGGGPSDPSTLPLINGWDESVFTIGGGFKVENGGGLDYEYSKSNPIAMSSSGNLWIGSARGALANDFHVAEIQIPTLTSPILADDFNAATTIQSRLNLQESSDTGSRYASPGNGSQPRGLFEFGGKLVCVNHGNYGGFEDFKDILLVLNDASDAANSTVTGYIDIDCEWFGMGTISDIPSEWQGAIGHNHFCGAPHLANTNQRSSKGPSFFGFNINDILNAPANVSYQSPSFVQTERFMSFPSPTKHAATAVNASYSLTSAPDPSGPFDGNNVYNHISRGNGAFIIPGTRTVVFLGGSGGMSNAPVTGLDSWVVYKPSTVGTLDGGTTTGPGGFSTTLAYDYYPFYWMYDLNDLIDVKIGVQQPDEIAPYSWGRVPESFFPWLIHPSKTRDSLRSIFHPYCISSCIDAANNRIFVVQARGHNNARFPIVWTINYDVSGL